MHDTQPLVLHGVEQDAGCELTLSDGRSVRLYGIVDRLDGHTPDVVRVVDYKTGSVKGRDDCRDVDKLFDRSLAEKRPSVAFQLYFYALMETRMASGSAVSFEPCIYSLRSIFSPELPPSHALGPEQLVQFETRLAGLVEEIFDPNRPFKAADSDEVCKNCNFKRLCNRQ